MVAEIKRRSLAWGVGAASVAEIDGSTSITRPISRCGVRSRTSAYDHVLVDGRKIVGFEAEVGPYTSIVDGDASSYAIACASIIAKVTRDRLMTLLAARYPGYGWERNAGYATRDHVAGLERLGVTPFHRRGYQRIRAMLEGEQLAFGLDAEAGSDVSARAARHRAGRQGQGARGRPRSTCRRGLVRAAKRKGREG
ncbi:MAG: ribonuclease HII [Chloroflexota bacterium]